MDVQKVLTLIQNRDVQTNLFIFFICVSLLQFFDTKIILGIGLFIFIIINYDKIMTTGNTEDIVKGEKARKEQIFQAQKTKVVEQQKIKKSLKKIEAKEKKATESNDKKTVKKI